MEAAVRSVVDGLLQRLSVQPRTVVLTGSVARGEGSAVWHEGRLRVLGDMEFLVIFEQGTNRGFLQRELDRHAQELGAELAASTLECELEFRAIYAEYFQAITPHIFGYELLQHGRTVWGDATILASAPRWPASAIPLWDAWRMLNNRMLEQLQWAGALIDSDDKGELAQIFYHLIKCHLDFATATLLFAGRYTDSYAGRALEFERWASHQGDPPPQFVREMAEKVESCTAFKLHPDANESLFGIDTEGMSAAEIRRELRKAMSKFADAAEQAWNWTARILCEESGSSPGGDLLPAVLATQPQKAKVRAWAKLMSMPEVRRQRGFGARALRMWRKGTPRYLVYFVAAQLYFLMPAVLAGKTPAAVAAEWEALLPVTFDEFQAEERPWWRLRANVLKGWRCFLRNHWS